MLSEDETNSYIKSLNHKERICMKITCSFQVAFFSPGAQQLFFVFNNQTCLYSVEL